MAVSYWEYWTKILKCSGDGHSRYRLNPNKTKGHQGNNPRWPSSFRMYNGGMEPVSSPSPTTWKLIWSLRHIFKVPGVANEEQSEYGRLLQQLLKVRSDFLALGQRNPDAVAYRYPFNLDLCERHEKPILDAVMNHLTDTLSALKRFGWDDSDIKAFQLLFFDNTRAEWIAMAQATKGENLIDALYQHERLLRSLQTKGTFSDIERRLLVANKRATGIPIG